MCIRDRITGLGSMTGELNVTVENCTFVSMAPAAMTFFDLNPKNTSSFNLIVQMCIRDRNITEQADQIEINHRTQCNRFCTESHHAGTCLLYTSKL